MISLAQNEKSSAACRISLPACFSLDRTLDCGQCFRFTREEDGTWHGVARGKSLALRQDGGVLLLAGIGQEEFDREFRQYFDFDRDYAAIDRLLCRDARLRAAADYARGIRILQQEPWETLCSFILSQNNNSPRIRGIIDRLCRERGALLSDGQYAFPGAKTMAAMSTDDFAPLRAGFRVKYLMDASRRVAEGDIDFDLCRTAPLAEAEAELCKIKGVGKKVADCVLLFSLGRMEAFPSDVWIKRVMAALFPDGLPEEFAPVAGIAQQYLYHYSRMCPQAL